MDNKSSTLPQRIRVIYLWPIISKNEIKRESVEIAISSTDYWKKRGNAMSYCILYRYAEVSWKRTNKKTNSHEV